MNLFGKKKKEINPNDIILNLQKLLQELDKKEIFLEKKISSFQDQARLCVKNKQKSKALYYLKNSVLYKKQLDSILNTKFNVDIQICNISHAIHISDTINVMKESKEILSSLGNKNNPDDVAELMDDIEEKIDVTQEISDLVGKQLHISGLEDENALLEELERELLDQVMIPPKIEQQISLPDVPTKKITEDEELEQLHQIMNV